MKGSLTTPNRPQSNGVCECMNQMIENIIKCTVREEWTTWDESLDLVMMAYRATPQTLTGFTPNMLVTGNELNMPVNLIHGSPKCRRKLHNYKCYCNYVEDLQNFIVDTYFTTRTCLGNAANRQCIMTGTQPLIILRKEIGSFIGINQTLCKPCLVVGQVPL